MSIKGRDGFSAYSERRFRGACLFFAVAFFAIGATFCSVKTITIRDGGQTFYVLTAKSDPYALLSATGIELKHGDCLYAPDTLKNHSNIRIIRGVEVELKYPGGGKILTVQPSTVEKIVSDYYEDFNPMSDVILYPTGKQSFLSSEQDVYPIEVISPARFEMVVLKKTEPLSYKTVYESEPLLIVGQRAVLTPGEHGLKEVSYEVYLKDGEQISQTFLGEEIIEQPQNEVVRVGSGASGGAGVLLVDGEEISYSAVYDMKATAYYAGSRTATGTTPKRGTVAVDPSVIPLGTRLYIVASDGTSWVYGTATAEDTGGVIKGGKIDLFVESKAIALRFGVKSCKVYVLD